MFAAPRARAICVGPVMKILVIDDDERMRRLIERTLSQGGYQVVVAADGETGRSPGGRPPMPRTPTGALPGRGCTGSLRCPGTGARRARAAADLLTRLL